MALPEERLRVRERQYAPLTTVEGARVSWAGVWTGLLVALGVLMLLSALGLAIGVSTADLGTGTGASAKGLGIGAGIWAGLSLLVALFIGGSVAARLGTIVDDRFAALIQGGLVWVLAMLGILYLAGSGISLGAGTLFGVASGAAKGAGAVVASGVGGLADLASGDVNQIMARLSDPTTIVTVAGATGMSQDEARAALGDIRRRVEAARDNPAEAAAAAREGIQQLGSRVTAQAQAAAQAAQPYAAGTSWAAFFALSFSLIAALLGAAWGARLAEARLNRP